jgi:outer membrane protein
VPEPAIGSVRAALGRALLGLLLALTAPPTARAQGADAPALTLAEAVARAMHGTAAVDIAQFRTREAEARITQARASLLPTISGGAYTQDRTFNIKSFGIAFPTPPGSEPIPDLVGPVRNVDARVRATQTLFDYAGWVRMSAAKNAVSAFRAESQSSSQAAAQAAALGFVRAIRADATVAARMADLDVALQLDSLAAGQVEAGTGAEIDVIRARTQVAAARGLLLVARNQAQRARIDLARSLGLEPDARFVLADSLSPSLARSAAPATTEAALTLALAQRADLHAEHARLVRARMDRRAIGAERLPRLDVSGDYGVNGENAHDAIATREVSLELTVPLLDGFRREGRIAEQSAVASEAEVRERDLRRQIGAEVESALLELSSGLEQDGIAGERLTLADAELTQARERFINGVAGNIEVINAQASLIRARDAVIEARAAIATARINLARATGVAETVR